MVGNIFSSFRHEENSSQHSTLIPNTTIPLQIEYYKDGCIYTFIIDISFRFDEITWYKRIEITSDGNKRDRISICFFNKIKKKFEQGS